VTAPAVDYGALRLAAKKLVLINAAEPLPNLDFLL
jgi:hypothetical protein